MQAVTLILQSSLLVPLVEFATSSSGHVEPRQGLALGWLGSVVAGLAVVFGTAERAQADSCHGIPEGSGSSENCSWICLQNSPCRFKHNGEVATWYRAKYCHSESKGCRQDGNWSCSCVA